MITAKDLPALKERCRTLLRDEMNVAKFEEAEDGDFTFRYERMKVKLVFDNEDPSFVWLACFGFHWLKRPTAAELATADRSINAANFRVKTVKVVRMPQPDKDGDHAVTASISLFVENVEALGLESLERYLHQIKVAGRAFSEGMEEGEATLLDEVTPMVDSGLRH